MSDLFISYSREDQEFVKQLVTALDKQGRSLWVDWEDIPWTSDWWEEIKHGIRNQDNFIFVLSESSLTSPVCMLEVEQAIINNKRLIPIVLAEADHRETVEILKNIELDAGVLRIMGERDLAELSQYNWRYLARHNWLFFNDKSQFEKSLANLGEAIDTDVEYIHDHTRYLTRAHEWDRKQRNDSLLLIGSEVTASEAWLASSAEKEPRPTQLHTTYIHASRKRANRIQQRLLTGVSIALFVTIILGLISLLLWQQAERERARADQQARVSESGRIAVQALLETDDANYDRALLLSLEALAIDDNREARSSLATSLQNVPQLTRFLHDHDDWVRTIAYSPDGTEFISADQDGKIFFWNHEALVTVGDSIQGAEGGIWSLGYHPDGDTIASAGDDGSIRLWDVLTRDLQMTLTPDSASTVYAVAFHPDGDVLASAHADNMIYLWDLATGEQTATLEGHTDWVSALTFSDDGTQLASGGRGAAIFLWDTTDLDNVTQAQDLAGHSNWVFALDFNPQGTMLVSGAADNTVRLWDTTTGDPLGQPLTDHFGWVRDVAFSQDGSLLASASADRTLILRDPTNGRRLRGVPPLNGHSEEIFALTFHPTENTLISADQDGAILIWDALARQPFAETIAQSNGAIYALGTSDDAIQSVSNLGVIQAFAPDGTSLGEPTQADTEILSAVVAAESTHYAYSLTDGRIITSTDQKITELAGHDALILALAYNADATELASSGEDMLIKRWDISTGDPIGTDLELFETPVSALAYHPSGSHLVAGSEAGRIIYWDTDSESVVLEFPHLHTDNITVLMFHPNGSLLASGSRDGTIILWDIATGEPLGQPLSMHQNWVLDLSFSPDGTTLASVSRDETLILWDVATRQPIGQPFAGQHSWIWQVEFAADGDSLLTGNRDGTIERWTIDLLDWRARACQIANRDLTPIERETYLSALSTSTICNVAITE